MKLDSFGNLVNDDGDGGDTARHEWSFNIALWINADIISGTAYGLFKDDCHILLRNQDLSKWWSDASTVSRDQTMHAFTYLGFLGGNCLEQFKAVHKARWYRCQNGEPLWAFFSVILRAERLKRNYALLMLTDLFYIIAVLERCGFLPRWNQDTNRLIWRRDPDDVGDDLNLQMCLVQPGHETLIRMLARKLYKWLRPPTWGHMLPETVNVAHSCWTWYYRAESRNSLWIPAFWAPICAKYF